MYINKPHGRMKKTYIFVYGVPSIQERKLYCEEQFRIIYPEIKRSVNPHEYDVDLTEKLLDLKKKLIRNSMNASYCF